MLIKLEKQHMDGQPFFFDNNVFDDDPLVGMGDTEKPEFTASDMEQARQKAFLEGKNAGFKESETGLTNNILAILKKLERDIVILFAAEDDRSKTYEEEAVHLTLLTIEKLFPLYTKKCGTEELLSAIETALTSHKTPSKINIELQDTGLEPLKEYIDKLEGDLHKQVTLIKNSALQKDECNILWPDGGIICSRNDISKKILETMKETLADRGVSVHDEEEQPSDSKGEKS